MQKCIFMHTSLFCKNNLCIILSLIVDGITQVYMFKNFIESFIEKYSFGVCRYLGDKMGLSESRVRLYFIYTSFATFGSPVILYLATAFWINIKKYLREGWFVKPS